VLDVGDSGTGTLNIGAGGRVESFDGNLGHFANSEGNATISGPNSQWINSHFLLFGNAGTGTLTIQNGGSVSSAGGDIGFDIGFERRRIRQSSDDRFGSAECFGRSFGNRLQVFRALRNGFALVVQPIDRRGRGLGRPIRPHAPAPGSQGPLRLIVPLPPGTGIDLIARTVGPRLGQRLGRPVVVDNRAGASGNIGTEAVVRSAPDGNTLLVSVNTLVMNRGLYPQLPFDPVKDLLPVSLNSWGQLLLVTHPGTRIRTAGELVAAAKTTPGRLNYASPGVGTPHHMSMELFKQTAGVFLTHIPYRGTAQAVTSRDTRTVPRIRRVPMRLLRQPCRSEASGSKAAASSWSSSGSTISAASTR